MIQSAVGELKNLIDANTIMGEPIHLASGTMVLPVSKLSLGFVSGGGEYGTKNPVIKSGYLLDNGNRAYPMAGTMTAGMAVTPVAFLAVQNDEVRILHVSDVEPTGMIANLLPPILTELKALLVSARQKGQKCEQTQQS